MASFTNQRTGEVWDSDTYTGDDQEVIAAPGAGKAILIKYFNWTSDSDSTVIFECGGTNVLAGQYVAANSGMIAPIASDRRPEHDGIMCTANTALTVSASAGNVYVNILYKIVTL